jgi:alpha-D-ribose 1-methylphosphonate 5-triphosphate synthase subunit PhnL
MSAVLEVRELCKAFTLHTIDGRTVASLRGVNLSVAAGEHVAIAARRRGLDLAEAFEAAASLRRLGLDEALWDVDCGVLSGGERQRINLAAGTVRPPRLLLLDEPVSALDPANRELALSLVSSLASQGVAVLAVFHDLDAIRRLATRVVRMEGGQVVASGTADEILGEVEAVS